MNATIEIPYKAGDLVIYKNETRHSRRVVAKVVRVDRGIPELPLLRIEALGSRGWATLSEVVPATEGLIAEVYAENLALDNDPRNPYADRLVGTSCSQWKTLDLAQLKIIAEWLDLVRESHS